MNKSIKHASLVSLLSLSVLACDRVPQATLEVGNEIAQNVTT
jgi:hypothetical protein